MNVLARRLIIAGAGALLPIVAMSGLSPVIGSADPIVPNCPGGWWILPPIPVDHPCHRLR